MFGASSCSLLAELLALEESAAAVVETFFGDTGAVDSHSFVLKKLFRHVRIRGLDSFCIGCHFACRGGFAASSAACPAAARSHDPAGREISVLGFGYQGSRGDEGMRGWIGASQSGGEFSAHVVFSIEMPRNVWNMLHQG